MTGGRVVVLGKTGRNFAAGMSGGIAYVYDPQRNLERLTNLDMVELDPVAADDEAELKAMIKQHYEYTGSDPAEWVLDNWSTALPLFRKVMPKDYKAVLVKQKNQVKDKALTV
jgi:glutamate synthase (NADPH) large chain